MNDILKFLFDSRIRSISGFHHSLNLFSRAHVFLDYTQLQMHTRMVKVIGIEHILTHPKYLVSVVLV